MRHASMLLLAIVWVVASRPASAEDREAARTAYGEGTRYYDLSQYSEALEAFKRAYWNYEDPAFLYNIAQCHRQLGHKSEALTFYRTFLRKSPDAPNRETVEKIVTALQSEISASPPASEAPAPSPPAPLPSAPSPPAPSSVAPSPDVRDATTLTERHSERVPPRRRRIYQKWWLWTGVGVVAAGIAVGLGVGLTSGHSRERVLPTVSLQ